MRLPSTFFLFVVFTVINVGAQNLVENGSFEKFRACPGTFSQRPSDFQVIGWKGGALGTPDHFHYCSRGEAGVPYNWAGTSEAYEGDGYAGLYLWKLDETDYHEYLLTRLLQPLIKDSTYYIEFHYKLSSYSNYAIDRIGLHLLENPPMEKHDRTIAIKPVLDIVKDSAFTRFTGTWEAARFEYKANGNESYVLIGNFHRNDVTKSYRLLSRPVSEPMLSNAAYYYIDAVLVVAKYKVRAQFATNIASPFSPEHVNPNTTYVLKNIQFPSNSVVLAESSSTELDALAHYLTENPQLKIELSGHTDDVGDDKYNLELSRGRAESVATYLKSKGVSGTRIRTEGYGESQPLIYSESSDARAVNRRVELKFVN